MSWVEKTLLQGELCGGALGRGGLPGTFSLNPTPQAITPPGSAASQGKQNACAFAVSTGAACLHPTLTPVHQGWGALGWGLFFLCIQGIQHLAPAGKTHSSNIDRCLCVC